MPSASETVPALAKVWLKVFSGPPGWLRVASGSTTRAMARAADAVVVAKDGLDGVHVHMTNTSNLPAEALEVVGEPLPKAEAAELQKLLGKIGRASCRERVSSPV